jgi:hypothetical protein
VPKSWHEHRMCQAHAIDATSERGSSVKSLRYRKCDELRHKKLPQERGRRATERGLVSHASSDTEMLTGCRRAYNRKSYCLEAALRITRRVLSAVAAQVNWLLRVRPRREQRCRRSESSMSPANAPAIDSSW